ncbi:galactose-1-phosphate uridylyltransferase [Nocardiopsis coralliicola]
MKRTSARLADGREIIYFDEDDGASRSAADTRDLPPHDPAPETRYDPLLGEWVVMAAQRQSRTHQPPSDACPLCPSTPERATEVPEYAYDVAAFENRFPSLAAGGPEPEGDVFELEPSRRAAQGRCEVLCFSSDHTASFADLPLARIRTIVDAWADRTAEISRVPGVEQVFCFENRGAEIGVTLPHPHGQIYGYPFITPRTRRVLDSAAEYQRRTGGDLLADNLAAERKAGLRIVAETQHWTAFVPAAARWPVEVHLYPKRKVADIPALTGEERDDFAALYRDVLRRGDRLFDRPLPYIAAWHQAPVHTGRDLSYLHLELFSVRRAPNKLKYLAGSESGMGVFVSDVLPEDVAARLRDAAE